jgi:ubiquinone/menaquinone biosynthesis C-methylase UbiE
LLDDYPNYSSTSVFSRVVKILDVGSRTGIGVDLVAQLYKGPWSNFILDCDVLDIDDGFFDYAKVVCNHVSRFIISDVADIDSDSYDYVIASHVLEHVDDYMSFCNHLKRIAKKNVFISCPYNEFSPINGHNTITDTILEQIGAVDIDIKKNWWWRNPARPDWSIVMFKLK